MRRRDYPASPMVLVIVLGNMMNSNLRHTVSIASSSNNMMASLFGKPITIVFLICTMAILFSNIPVIKKVFSKNKQTNQKYVYSDYSYFKNKENHHFKSEVFLLC